LHFANDAKKATSFSSKRSSFFLLRLTYIIDCVYGTDEHMDEETYDDGKENDIKTYAGEEAKLQKTNLQNNSTNKINTYFKDAARRYGR